MREFSVARTRSEVAVKPVMETRKKTRKLSELLTYLEMTQLEVSCKFDCSVSIIEKMVAGKLPKTRTRREKWADDFAGLLREKGDSTEVAEAKARSALDVPLRGPENKKAQDSNPSRQAKTDSEALSFDSSVFNATPLPAVLDNLFFARELVDDLWSRVKDSPDLVSVEKVATYRETFQDHLNHSFDANHHADIDANEIADDAQCTDETVGYNIERNRAHSAECEQKARELFKEMLIYGREHFPMQTIAAVEKQRVDESWRDQYSRDAAEFEEKMNSLINRVNAEDDWLDELSPEEGGASKNSV